MSDLTKTLDIHKAIFLPTPDNLRRGKRSGMDIAGIDPVDPQTPGAPPDPVAMPDEEEIRRGRRRSLAMQRMRRGRASTILTDTGVSDSLGA